MRHSILHPLILSLFALASLPACAGDDGDSEGSGTTDDAGTTEDGTGDTTGDTTDTAGDTTSDTAGGATCEGVPSMVTEISPDELAAMLESKDFALINVHIPYAGEIPGTDVHIAYTETAELEAYLGNDHGAKAVLYCQTGPMSAIASAALAELGYCHIYDMPAGMIGWEAEGHPIEGKP
ncbi:MAG: rhodanese-like domain-containing protein [Myxococcales bacterium]|nr:rhodanese-like domain-containing protein [Myxococcales bacterium]